MINNKLRHKLINIKKCKDIFTILAEYLWKSYIYDLLLRKEKSIGIR